MSEGGSKHGTPTPGFEGVGWALIICGLIGLGFAYFGMSTSVSSPGAYGLPENILNIGLLSNRELVFQASGLAILGGIVLMAASRLIEAIERPKG